MYAIGWKDPTAFGKDGVLVSVGAFVGVGVVVGGPVEVAVGGEVRVLVGAIVGVFDTAIAGVSLGDIVAVAGMEADS